jgi:hypothetical protein
LVEAWTAEGSKGKASAANATATHVRVRNTVRTYHQRVSLALLFSVIALALLGIAVASALAGEWPIAVAAAAIGAWMGSFAWTALRKARS